VCAEPFGEVELSVGALFGEDEEDRSRPPGTTPHLDTPERTLGSAPGATRDRESPCALRPGRAFWERLREAYESRARTPFPSSRAAELMIGRCLALFPSLSARGARAFDRKRSWVVRVPAYRPIEVGPRG
jgi:hypothetical protein